MAQWYCIVESRQYGPVDEDVFLDWIADGRVRANTYVWTEGFDGWVYANQAFEDMFGSEGVIPSAGPEVTVPAPPGAGGQTPNAELMTRARANLRGRWGLPILICFLADVLVGAAGSVPFAGVFAQVLIGGPIALGLAIYFLTFMRRGRCNLEMLFNGFRNFVNALLVHLLRSIFVFLWTFLLIVPGILAALSYSQTMYLIAQDRTLKPMEAIRRSKDMMYGYRWKYFCLNCRFIGWALLCILTLGIGFFWLSPYMAASYAAFHDDLRSPEGPPAHVAGPQQLMS